MSSQRTSCSTYVPNAPKDDRIYGLLSSLADRYVGRVIRSEDYDVAHGLAMLAYAEMQKVMTDFLGEGRIQLADTVFEPSYVLIPGCRWGFMICLTAYENGIDIGVVSRIQVSYDAVAFSLPDLDISIPINADKPSADSMKALADYAFSDERGSVFEDNGRLNPLELDRMMKERKGPKPLGFRFS